MSKKKYTKLLAAAWCATTMASFYAAPVYAANLTINGVAAGADTVTVTSDNLVDALAGTDLAVNSLTVGGNAINFGDYLTSTSAASTYATQASLADYLKSTDAASTYATQASLADYLKSADAATTYLSQTDAESTYLKSADAAANYAAKSVEGDVTALKSTVGDAGAGLVKDVADNKANIQTNANNITALKSTVGDSSSGLVKDMTDAKANISALEGKTANLSSDGSELTGMTKVAATTITDGTATLTGGALSGVTDITASGKVTAGSLALGAQELTEAKIADYDKTVTNTAGIERTSGATNYTTIEGKVKVGDDGTVLINEGDTNQVKIDSAGLHVGTTSTHMATDGVYAGGTDYAGAKAAIATDGRIKGADGKFEVAADGSMKAADGKFTVDAAGNAAVGGTLEVTGASTLNDKLTVTAGGAAITGDTSIKGNTTIEGTLGAGANGTEFTVDAAGKVVAKGGLSVGDAEQFTVDAATGNIVSKGSITAASGQIGSVGITNTGVVTGVTSLDATTITTDTLIVASFNSTGNMSVGGDLTVAGTINGAAIKNTQFNGVILEGGNVSATDVNASNVNATGTIQGTTIKANDNNMLTSAGITASAGTIGGVSLKDNKVTANSAAIQNVATTEIKLGTTTITQGSIADANGININGVNLLGSKVTADSATLETATIGTHTIINADGIATNGVKIGDTFITDGKIADATGININEVQMQSGKVTAANGFVVDANNSFDSTGLKATQGTFADSVTVGAAGTQTTIGGGEATFSKGANAQTVIDGGTITANKLKVDEIVLGKDADGSGDQDIVIGADGKFSAAGGNFAIVGGNGTDRGALTNIVGGTKFKTTADGAEFSHKNAAGNVSGLTIGDNNVALSVQNNGGVNIDATSTNVHSGNAGMIVENNSLVNKVGTDVRTEMDNTSITDTVGSTSSTMTQDSITDKVGDTTVKTENGKFSVSGSTGKGMSIDTNSGKVTFEGNSTPVVSGGATNTTIDGNTITTGHLITDKLTIKGQGSAGGDGQIALGGDGSIESNIKDGDKETTFKTDANGIKAQAQDKATGSGSTLDVNSNKISAGVGTTDKHASQFLTGEFASTNVQNTTTGETSEHVQEAGKITDKVTDGNGKTSERVQTSSSITDKLNGGFVEVALDEDSITQKAGEGKVEITNDAITNTVGSNSTKLDANGFVVNHGGKDVTIANGDVTIGAAGEAIRLSELGQMKDLDAEITSREEYTNNKTAVGAINAEAGIRRQEIARLDGRIDDVSERVDKVGAMSAAIASLRTMGYDPQAPSEFAIGLGHYKGETGIAMGYFHYPSRDFMINVSLSTAGGETMGGLGATWRFGHKSPQELLEKQRAEQLKKQLQAAEKYEAAVKLAKEAQERADYAAKVAAEAQKHAEIAKADADYTESKIAE